ncbi:MAG: hypothetical protein ABL917_00895 [Parcubacteria group bacterium]
MATTKHRINITADKDIEKALISSAKRDGVPTASKAADLIRLALDIEEDVFFGNLASERLSAKNTKWVSHKNTWR